MQSCWQAAEQGIGDLNEKYAVGGRGRFFLLHRPRLFNEQEGVWMARERKRGKLEDFGALLRGRGRNCFSAMVGNAAELTTIENVIVLDSDAGSCRGDRRRSWCRRWRIR